MIIAFRKKLKLLTGLAVASALTVSAMGLIGLQWKTDREQAEQRFVQAASIISSNIAPAILFEDPAVAGENLESIQGLDGIGWVEAVLPGGQVFASYDAAPGARADQLAWEAVVERPIRVDGRQIATLRVGVHYRSLSDILFDNLGAAALITMVAFAIAVLLSHWMDRIAHKPIDTLMRAMRKISASGDSSVRLEQSPDPDLAAIITSFNAMLERLEQGNVALSQSAQALREARDAAEEANVAKSQFLANMSHELRTPLNAIIGYAEVLREELDILELKRSLEDVEWIHTSAHQLLGLINSILDLSKIEAGRMGIDLHEFSPLSVMQEIEGMLAPIAAQCNNTLQIVTDPDIGEAYSDATKLRQCLLNLGANACKFTENGQIFILARADGEDLVFSVSDTGIGMTASQLNRLFQPFVQADASTTRRYGGTGLGLTITWRFAHMLGGTVEVDSVEGAGTTFTLRIRANLREYGAGEDDIPNAVQTEAVLDNRLRSTAKPLALIIEDQPSALQLMTRLAQRANFETICAEEGETGLQLAYQHRPDMILLDLTLPRVNGWQVLEALQADPELRSIPTVVVTVDDDRSRTIEAGAADHLVKPIDHGELNDIFVQYSQKHDGAILIVEDDPGTANLYARGLNQMGYTTQVASGGGEAMRLLQQGTFALIITDLRMPDGDGFSLIDRVAEMPEEQRPKIMVVTGKVLNEEDGKALTGKVVRLIPKNGLSPRKLGRNVQNLEAHGNAA
ncbi:MAG: response regulator [Pseudomonadota bacterium]|nr:response regulator [Pseudomonadota bacterium]